jgi:hypothetical protein
MQPVSEAQAFAGRSIGLPRLFNLGSLIGLNPPGAFSVDSIHYFRTLPPAFRIHLRENNFRQSRF